MSSIEIAELTGKDHNHVVRDINTMLDRLGINPNPFLELHENQALKGQAAKKRIYHLPKRECLILASGYSVILRAAIIDRWIELESKQSQEIPQSFAEALQLAADQAKQLELQAPKVEGYDKFISADSLQSFKEVANILGWGRNKLMAKLRELKIINSKNLPYQRFLEMKLFEVKESTQSGFNVSVTYVTPKGIDYIRKAITK